MPEDHPLAPALRLAGLALAHAVWSIAGGEPLSTLALIQRSGGSRELHRYDALTVADSLDSAIIDVAGQLASGGKAAVVFEGYVTPEGGERTDALIVDVFGRDAEVLGRIVQPYRPARPSRIPFARPRGFALLGPPQASENLGGDAADALVLEGALEHEQAARHFRR